MNTPDVWKFVKIINNGKTYFKVMGQWYGGYAGSDYWKLNSGITKIEQHEDHYSVFGESGSVYTCYFHNENVGGLMASVMDGFQYRLKDDDRMSIDFCEISDVEGLIDECI